MTGQPLLQPAGTDRAAVQQRQVTTPDHLAVRAAMPEPSSDYHATAADIAASLDWIRQSPYNHGRLDLIVCRPGEGARQLLDSAELTEADGLVEDSWRSRPSSSTPNGTPNPDKQLTLMNIRFASVIAGDPSRRALAGDQLLVDFDLSVDNTPPGTCLRIGTAVVELTDAPHLGCAKFRRRFGTAAMTAVSSQAGRHLRLRGANAKVVTGGTLSAGDLIVIDQRPPAAPR